MRFMRRLLFSLSVAAVAGLASSSAYAQIAFLTGTVTDPGGAVLPGVELPLNGREFEDLAQLAPGSLPSAPGSTLSFRGGFNAGGARETANNHLLDGI